MWIVFLVQEFALSKLFDTLLYFPKVHITNLNTAVFRDQRLPRLVRPVSLIQEQIKSIQIPFLLDAIDFTGNLSYTEIADSLENTTYLEFTGLKGQLTHISNHERYLSEPMHLQAIGKLYDLGPFSAEVFFDMRDTLNTFDLNCRLYKMDLEILNQLVTPLAGIHIHSGRNKDLFFRITGNDQRSIGEMSFKYNKLNFHIVNLEDPEKLGFGNSLRSFFANRLVKSNNPSFLRRRMGIIYFERDPNKAIFNFWGKSILSGIISSVGVRNNRKRLKLMSEEELEQLNYKALFNEKFRPILPE